MKAGRYDFEIPIGDDWAKNWTIAGITAELAEIVGLAVAPTVTLNKNVVSAELSTAQTGPITADKQDHYKLRIRVNGKWATLIQGTAVWRKV